MTHHCVIAIRQHVDEAVVKLERQLDPGVFRQEPVKRWPQMQAAEADGSRDAQWPHQFASALADLCRGVGSLLYDAFGARVERSSILGKREFAGRTMEKFRTERAFQ